MKILEVKIKELPYNKVYYTAILDNGYKYEYMTHVYDRFTEEEFKKFVINTCEDID